jgi:hypothetical protein
MGSLSSVWASEDTSAWHPVVPGIGLVAIPQAVVVAHRVLHPGPMQYLFEGKEPPAPAQTIIESGSDGGNFRGVAIFVQGRRRCS